MMSLSILEGTAMFPKPIVDQRYQVLTCESCKRKILLFRDSSNGNANIGGSFALICPNAEGKQALMLSAPSIIRKERRTLCVEMT